MQNETPPPTNRSAQPAAGRQAGGDAQPQAPVTAELVDDGESVDGGIRFLGTAGDPASGDGPAAIETANVPPPAAKSARQTSDDPLAATPVMADPVMATVVEGIVDAVPVGRSTDDNAAHNRATEIRATENHATEKRGPESLLFRCVHGFGRVVEWPFGVACMVIGLAVLAALPVLHLISLGYLLEVSGRVARRGRIRSGFIGVRKAARAGSVVLGAWLCLLPVQLVSFIWYQSNLIAPHSDVTARWRTAQVVVTILLVAHIVTACYCGGRLRHFFWPLLAPFSLGMWIARCLVSNRPFRPIIEQTLGRVAPRIVRDVCNWRPLSDWFLPAVLIKGFARGTLYRDARDGLWDFVIGMRLPYFFWLGLRGLAGAVMWLIIPCLLLIGGVVLPPGGGGGICLLLGVPLMIAVVMYLPFLQAHFAAENRLGAYWELSRVRRAYRHAPVAFVIAFVITVVFAIPPFLFKIAPLSNLGATENELTWITCLVFVAFIFPAKLLTGWAVGRARKRPQPAHGALRWLLRPVMLVPPLAYVFVLFFTQYVSWHGTWSLLEQHIFLVPAPFFGIS